MWACPFGAPTADWDSLAPKIHKCTGCSDRAAEMAPVERNGEKLSAEDAQGFIAAHGRPACVNQCPTGALKYGDRDELLAEAHQRIADNPKKYVNHIYGEKEAGGTGVLYLSSVPFEQLGFPNVGEHRYPGQRGRVSAVPPAVLGMGALLGGAYAFNKRKNDVAKAEAVAAKKPVHDHHVEFAPVPARCGRRSTSSWRC